MSLNYIKNGHLSANNSFLCFNFFQNGSRAGSALDAKKHTPLGRIPTLKAFNSTSKLPSSSYMRSEANASGIAKSTSELKGSQEDFRKRELYRRKKEQEALMKKNTLLAQQMEEKRKKREEKQAKARLTREALEKEKIEQLRKVEQAREEKHKLLLAEKEEKLQKQKEELAQKRAQALKRAAQQKQPLYLQSKMPLLPTPDAYDSDDPNAPATVDKPVWQQGKFQPDIIEVSRYGWLRHD